VLAGEGKSFCAGLDTANFATMMSGDLSADSENVKQTYADLSPAGANRAQQTGWLWQELAVPVIAAVQGSALGGGLNLALAADITVMAADAKLGFVEIGWGLMPDMSASQSLRRLVGADRAKLLVLTGQIFSGAEAHAWGLATELADDPVGRATEIAQAIAANNPDAVRAALRVLNHSVDSDTTAGFAEETRVSSALIGGANQIEAVRARLSNEPANFEDSPRP
jgi:enoyl-CoA hydratase/carnithine racemase